MRDIDPDSEENQRQHRDNAAYVGGLILQERAEQQRTWDAVAVMRVKGGAFVKSLATAWFFADPENKAKLQAAFYSIFEKYQAISEQEES